MKLRVIPRYPALTDYIAGAALGIALAILVLCAYAEFIITQH